jgi:hypothetical protein
MLAMAGRAVAVRAAQQALEQAQAVKEIMAVLDNYHLILVRVAEAVLVRLAQ